MKLKTGLFCLMFLLLCSFSSSAAILTVSNVAGVDADYTTIQAAHDAASNGDSIYVMGSAKDYEALTVTKRLYFYGPGYFGGENFPSQANIAVAKLAVPGALANSVSIDFVQGSEGSIITGFEFANALLVNADNITIKRNLFLDRSRILSKNNGTVIIQNFFGSMDTNISGENAGLSIINNIFKPRNGIYNTYPKAIYSGYYGNAYIVNNTFVRGNLALSHISNILLKNNIFADVNSVVSLPNYSFSFNNVCAGNPSGTENGNQANVDMATVFVDSGTSDGKYQLKTGSPALGAGLEGEDCGAFGGNSPYVLSGLSHIPSTYYFKAPPVGTHTGGLPVVIKIKSND